MRILSCAFLVSLLDPLFYKPWFCFRLHLLFMKGYDCTLMFQKDRAGSFSVRQHRKTLCDSSAELLPKKLLLCPRPQEGLLLCLTESPLTQWCQRSDIWLKVENCILMAHCLPRVPRNTACHGPGSPLFSSIFQRFQVWLTPYKWKGSGNKALCSGMIQRWE